MMRLYGVEDGLIQYKKMSCYTHCLPPFTILFPLTSVIQLDVDCNFETSLLAPLACLLRHRVPKPLDGEKTSLLRSSNCVGVAASDQPPTNGGMFTHPFFTPPECGVCKYRVGMRPALDARGENAACVSCKSAAASAQRCTALRVAPNIICTS